MGKIVGIFGISGTGKSSLCREISSFDNNYAVFRGSEVIAKLIPQGQKFDDFSIIEKHRVRLDVVKKIQHDALLSDKILLIDGHYCFIKNDEIDIAWTEIDGRMYSAIFYLDLNADAVLLQHKNDKSRERLYSRDQIIKWLEIEKQGLEKVCKINNIPFFIINDSEISSRKKKLLMMLREHKIV